MDESRELRASQAPPVGHGAVGATVQGAAEDTAPMQAPSRDEGPQYALPLVVRVERGAAPAWTDALESADAHTSTQAASCRFKFSQLG